jgi:Flp pilus assembly protein TadG
MKNTAPRPRQRQQGAAAVEFALVASVLLMLLFGSMELSKMMFYWNSATEATRLGARIAAICPPEDNSAAKAAMTAIFPIIHDADIQIRYLPGGCNADNCEQLTVSIDKRNGLQTLIPFVSVSLLLPSFSTTLPRESMRSAANPVCGS